VWTIIPLGFYPYQTAVPAWVMLIYWAFLQFAGGITSVVSERSGGVAFWAHLGGFVAGVVLVKVFERRDRMLAHVTQHWRPRY
jgi:membrane associated rhomboid family serine protease